ncbi:MAG: alpha/beta hydrolase fold domain-containing protein, partial [Nocardioidaceae bacterium]
ASAVHYAEGFGLTTAEMRWSWHQYLQRPEDWDNPWACPQRAPSLAGLPPAVVVTAQFDVLRDEGIAYADRLRRDGVPVSQHEYEGSIHGFLWMGGRVDDSRTMLDDLQEDLSTVWGMSRCRETDTDGSPATPPAGPATVRHRQPTVAPRGDTGVMAYDQELADRIRDAMATEAGVSEKRMFGGLAFLVHGRMAVAASGQGGLMVRIDPADADSLVREPQVRRFEMHGREMDGWLRVEPEAVATDEELGSWVDRGVGYASTLPPR